VTDQDLPLPESWQPGAVDAEAAPANITELAELLAIKRTAREMADEESKRIRKEEEAVERDLFDALERVNLRSVKHKTLGTFSLNDLAWAKIEDRQRAIEWAEHVNPDLLTLNNQSLSKYVRDILRGEVEGATEPPPGVSYTVSRKITWRGKPS
jgi:hypothetical protein